MAPVLSLNPKAEVTTLPPTKIKPEDVVSVEDHIIKSLQQTTAHLGKIAVQDLIETHLRKNDEASPSSILSPFQKSIDAYSIGETEIFFLEADYFSYVLYRENPKCWKKKPLEEKGDIGYLLNKMGIEEGLELIKTDSLEAKGSVPMYHFVAGHTYEVNLWYKRNMYSKFDTPCRLTLVIADGLGTKVVATSLPVNDIKPGKFVPAKLGEFTVTGKVGEVRFSLINFDPNWKSGIVLVGLFIEPVYVLKPIIS